ncbi:hypothetical protein KHA80_04410 [Anaerobacillus sp. HL2]|nr:hypothetical protein KHA80_04410 [Anaerobacillus sp. HL2]
MKKCLTHLLKAKKTKNKACKDSYFKNGAVPFYFTIFYIINAILLKYSIIGVFVNQLKTTKLWKISLLVGFEGENG